MNAWARRRRRLRSWPLVVLALTALAFAPRALIPQGYMPAGAGFALVVCPDGLSPAAAALFAHAHGEHAHAVPADATDAHSHHRAASEPSAAALPQHGTLDAHRDTALGASQCAFAAAALLAPAHSVDIAVVGDGAPPALPPDRAAMAPILAPTHRPQQARAPPQHS